MRIANFQGITLESSALNGSRLNIFPNNLSWNVLFCALVHQLNISTIFLKICLKAFCRRPKKKNNLCAHSGLLKHGLHFYELYNFYNFKYFRHLKKKIFLRLCDNFSNKLGCLYMCERGETECLCKHGNSSLTNRL